MQHAPEINRYLAFERLEAWNSNDANGQSWEVEGWLGSDLRRLWLRSEGRRSEGATHAANVELLYGRSVTPWWDLVAGVRHDFAPGRSQTRAAFGLQGLAPYGIELEATAHVGGSSRATLVVEAGYELLLTNRLVLEPVIEATFAASGDAPRGLGQGLSTVETGLRLRYEIDRRFAPYAGVVHDRAYGDTARLHRAEGTPTRDTRLVAGFRIWF